MDLTPETRQRLLAELLGEMKERLAALGMAMSDVDETTLQALVNGSADAVVMLHSIETSAQQPSTNWAELRDSMGLNAARRPYSPHFRHLTPQRYMMVNRLGDGRPAQNKMSIEGDQPIDIDSLLDPFITPASRMTSSKLAHYILMSRPDVMGLLLLALIFATAEAASRENL